MEIKIKIKTPPGQALFTQHSVGMLILGTTKTKETYVNDDKSELIWVIDAPIRKIMDITRKIGMFNAYLKVVLTNPKVRKLADGQDVLNKVDAMLMENTKIEIIREADAHELVEANETFWDRVKNKWNKL